MIYWTWNNLLSIAQQYWIMQMDKKRQTRAAAAPPPPKPAAVQKGKKG